LAAHDVRAGRRRQAAAERGAGFDSILDVALAVEGILDGAIAGAAADVSLERRAEIRLLRLVQRSTGQNHAGGAEAALEALRVEKGLLHRMGAAVRRKALDGRDRTPLGTEGRDQAAMHRLAVEQNGAGAAIAGVATFLDAEMAEITQERAQALPRARRFRKRFAVDLKAHRCAASSNSLRISSASRSVMCLRQNGLPWT